MKIKYRNSFLKDIKKLKSKREKDVVKSVLDNIRKAHHLKEILHLEKLSGKKGYYKIKTPPFRFGLFFENDTVEMVRFGQREDFYKYFPPGK